MTKQRFKIQLIVCFIILFSFFNSFFLVFAQATNDLPTDIMFRLRNVATGDPGAGFKEVATGDLTETIGNIIKIVLTFLGIVFLILVIYGGYIWMTAHGNEERVTKAKDLITEALIGLVIILGAYIITYFVVNALITQTGYQE
jgi:hypothetical protein